MGVLTIFECAWQILYLYKNRDWLLTLCSAEAMAVLYLYHKETQRKAKQAAKQARTQAAGGPGAGAGAGAAGGSSSAGGSSPLDSDVPELWARLLSTVQTHDCADAVAVVQQEAVEEELRGGEERAEWSYGAESGGDSEGGETD
jgi:hypothetical protein